MRVRFPPPASARLVRERLQRSGCGLELARLEALDDHARKPKGLALVAGPQHGVDRRERAAVSGELDVHGVELPPRDVRVLRDTHPHVHLAAVRELRDLLDGPPAQTHGESLLSLNVRPDRDPGPVNQEHIAERLVRFRLRTILSLLGTIIAVAVVLEVIWISRHVLTWVIISVFLALALNPAVEWFQKRGLKRRGAAAAVTYLLTFAFFVGIGFTFVPTLVDQTNE